MVGQTGTHSRCQRSGWGATTSPDQAKKSICSIQGLPNEASCHFDSLAARCMSAFPGASRPLFRSFRSTCATPRFEVSTFDLHGLFQGDRTGVSVSGFVSAARRRRRMCQESPGQPELRVGDRIRRIGRRLGTG